MEDFGAIFGSMPLTRLAGRRGLRRQLEEEARVTQEPPQAGHHPGLSDHIPSPLIPLQDRVRALASGAPAWSRRLKRIHDLTAAIQTQLRDDWLALARERRMDAARFSAQWQRLAAEFNFATVNDLISRHNRYFPAEANLAMDVHTLDYVHFGGADYRLPLLDAAWLLVRFPADLAAARAAQLAER